MPEEIIKYIDELIELRTLKSELVRYLDRERWVDVDVIREIVGLPKKTEGDE